MDDEKNITICHKFPTPYIEVQFQGLQTRKSVQLMELKISEYIKNLNITEILLLVGLSNIGHFDLGAIDESLFPKINTQYEKIGIYGQSGFVKEATKMIVRSAGLFYKDRIKLFDSREDALEWLFLDKVQPTVS